MDECHCGPQRWPKWVREPLSRFYNRACKNHDENYDDADCAFFEAERIFKDEVTRRRRVLRKAWKRKKITLKDYILHGLVIGYLMYRFTQLFGRAYK